MMIVENNLQLLRWGKEWSQELLSFYSGVDRSVITKIENNDRPNPSITIALSLAKALGVKVEDIFALKYKSQIEGGQSIVEE